MERPVLARALEPWPTTIRTLDALHLATLEHLRSQGVPIELASYDNRLAVAAQALGNRAGAVVTSIDPANGTARQYGFIAQQVREVLPDLVNNTGIVSPATPDGLLHLDYNGLFAPIVAAIQELNARTRDMVGRHAGPAAFGPREPRDEGRRC